MSFLPILCIGSVLWDIIGRSASHMSQGSDVPGRINRVPGGVAMNIAMALRGFGTEVSLLSAVGRDKAGDDLMDAARARGILTDHVYLSDDLPTDVYMAVEGANGLIAAIADAHSLEAAGAKILEPLRNGALADAAAPWTGSVVLDGNLTEALLSEIVSSQLLSQADLRVAPASPGKAERLRTFLKHPSTTLYVNLEEAEILCYCRFASADIAAKALIANGLYRAVVTNGDQPAAIATSADVLVGHPPSVLVTRVTGAGDVFMASHIAAEIKGHSGKGALTFALEAAAQYISTETPL